MHVLVLEYRRIGLHPTCIGNDRIRIAADGALDYARNDRECGPGQQWTGDWQHLGLLDEAGLARIRQVAVAGGVLDLPDAVIDEAVEGGAREELDLWLAGRERHLVVQNAPCPPFQAFARMLRQTAADLRFRPRPDPLPQAD